MPSGASTPSLTDRRRLALYRPRQAAAERLHRELQRPAARRVVERDAVPLAAARPRRASRPGGAITTKNGRIRNSAGCRLGATPAPSAARPAGTLRFAGAPRPGLLPPTAQKAQINPGLPDSRSDWMKNGRHVIAPGAPLNILASNAEAHRGMPAITDLNFLPDMGRMTGRLP